MKTSPLFTTLTYKSDSYTIHSYLKLVLFSSIGDNIYSVIITNTSNSKDIQTYIGPIYLYHSYIRIYKRNSIGNLLL